MIRGFNNGEEFHHVKPPLLDGERQGKCTQCFVRFVWPTKKGRELKKAFCPCCGDKLERTTQLSKYPVRYKTPDFTPF